MQIGFIGLGTMGAHMAGNLQKAGHRLLVHDLRKDAAAPHLAAGAAWADTPRALAGQSDVIFTSLPEPSDVEKLTQTLLDAFVRDWREANPGVKAATPVTGAHSATCVSPGPACRTTPLRNGWRGRTAATNAALRHAMFHPR